MSADIERRSEFDGSVLGNFGTNFAATLLGIITLGIGVPSAVAYRQKWLTSHTVIEGKRLNLTEPEDSCSASALSGFCFR